MLNKTRMIYSALLGALLFSAPVAADDHTSLKDASFELRLAPDEGGWTLFEESLFSEDQARTGSHSMFNGGYSRTVAYHPFFVGVVSGSFQEFPAEPGSRWRLTGYGLAATKLQGTPAFGIIQVSFFDADGNDLGAVETADSGTPAKTSNEVSGRAPTGEWILLDTGVATAPEGTVSVQAFTIYVDYSGSNTPQGVYFDDLRLCALEGDEAECPPEQ